MAVEGHVNVLLFDFFALKAAPLVYRYMYYCANCGGGVYRVQVQLVYTAGKFVKFGAPFFPLFNNERYY